MGENRGCDARNINNEAGDTVRDTRLYGDNQNETAARAAYIRDTRSDGEMNECRDDRDSVRDDVREKIREGEGLEVGTDGTPMDVGVDKGNGGDRSGSNGGLGGGSDCENDCSDNEDYGDYEIQRNDLGSDCSDDGWLDGERGGTGGERGGETLNRDGVAETVEMGGVEVSGSTNVICGDDEERKMAGTELGRFNKNCNEIVSDIGMAYKVTRGEGSRRKGKVIVGFNKATPVTPQVWNESNGNIYRNKFNSRLFNAGYGSVGVSDGKGGVGCNVLESDNESKIGKSFYLRKTDQNEDITEQICIQQHHLNVKPDNIDTMSPVMKSVKRGITKIKGIHDIEKMVEDIVTLSDVFGAGTSSFKVASQLTMMNEDKVNKLVDMLDSMPAARRSRKSELPTQIAMADRPMPYACDICEKSFKKRFNYMRHRLSHARRAAWVCNVCGKSFSSISMFNRHKPKHLPKNIQKLRTVAKNNALNLTQHVSSGSGPVFPTLTKILETGVAGSRKGTDAAYQCSHCGKVFRYKVLLTFHLNAVHDANVQQRYNCEDCGMKYRHKVSIKRHRKQRVRTDMRCEMCGEHSTSICEFRQHLITHTNDPVKPFMCSVCLRTFPRLICLTTHKYVHRDSKPFGCEICSKTFKTAHHLKSHIAFHNNPCVINVPMLAGDGSSTDTLNTDSLPRFVCGDCGRTYYTRSGLRRHYKQTHDITCSVCHAQFMETADLRRHARTHAKAKRAATKHCDVCGKNFQGNNDLRKHMRIHSGEKPFACELCPKTFRQSVHLREHRRKHTGERPFLCEVCQKTFQFSSSLRKHERTQHGLLLSHTPPRKVKTTPAKELLHVTTPFARPQARESVAQAAAEASIAQAIVHPHDGESIAGYTVVNVECATTCD